MTAPCGAQTRDVHGDAVCDLEFGHHGGHSGEVMAGIYLFWSAAPPLSPEERAVVERFEAAGEFVIGTTRTRLDSGLLRSSCSECLSTASQRDQGLGTLAAWESRHGANCGGA